MTNDCKIIKKKRGGGEIFGENPPRHIDIGSRVDGFVAHVAAFRKIEAVGVFQGAMHHEAQQQYGDIGQHQTDQDFIGVEPGP